MKKPDLPIDEQDRLRALYDLEILDTPIEEAFERITRLVQQLFSVPIVAITLIDKERQWFKSIQGLNIRETSREVSFCAHTILQDEIFYIPDARKDARFVDNPLVAEEPEIQFYAGYPLHNPTGKKIGVLCIIDTTKRKITKEQLGILKDFAAMAEAEIAKYSKSHLQVALSHKLNQLRSKDEIDATTFLWNRHAMKCILHHSMEYSVDHNNLFGVTLIALKKRHNKDFSNESELNEAMRHSAKVLLSVCRPCDILGRWGDNLFILLINARDKNDIALIIQRISQTYQDEDAYLYESPIESVLSIGVSFYDPTRKQSMGEILQECMKCVDIALRKDSAAINFSDKF